MPPWPALALFMIAALVLLLTPGPAVLYIVARSVHQGRRAGIVSALGVGVGTLTHVAAAALGLSALLVSSALAFALVKYAGAAYLITLGMRTLGSRARHEPTAPPDPQPLARIFTQGVVVNALNPKTALFFLAFLPQFVDPARGAVTAQILALGCLFVLLGIGTDSSYAILAGSAARRLKQSRRFTRAQRYLTSGIYIGLGITAALTGSADNP